MHLLGATGGDDLAVVEHFGTRVAVMYLGTVCEVATTATLFAKPRHPYTQALLSAVPITDPEVERTRDRIVLTGDVPSPLRPPSGCVFHTRCPIAEEVCTAEVPEWREILPSHWVACHLAEAPQNVV